MYQLVLVAGIAYFIFKEASSKDEPTPDVEPPTEDPTEDPTEEPSTPPGTQEVGREIASWSPEDSVGDEVVWTFQKGVQYKDGSRVMGSTYIVIGDKMHHNFLRANARGGTINIKWELTGNPSQRDSKNVVVFGSIEDALAYLEEEDEDDPTSPQKPEQPTNPTPPSSRPGGLPGYGLGNNDMTPTFGNGGL